MLSEDFPAPQVILPVFYYKFDLVRRFEVQKIIPPNGFRHPATGTFDIHDQNGTLIQPADVETPAGFNKHAVSLV